MIEITAEIRALIDKAAAGMELAGDEYIDPADGLIHCKKCGGQRQTVVPCFGKPGYFMPPLYLPVPAGGRGTAQGRRGTAAPYGAYQAPEGPGPAKTAICTTTPSPTTTAKIP